MTIQTLAGYLLTAVIIVSIILLKVILQKKIRFIDGYCGIITKKQADNENIIAAFGDQEEDN